MVITVSLTSSLNYKNQILTSWPCSFDELMRLIDSTGLEYFVDDGWERQRGKQTLINKSSSATIIISAKYVSLLPTVRPPRIYDGFSLYLHLSSSPARQSLRGELNLSLVDTLHAQASKRGRFWKSTAPGMDGAEWVCSSGAYLSIRLYSASFSLTALVSPRH